jgi:hypothetical protein
LPQPYIGEWIFSGSNEPDSIQFFIIQEYFCHFVIF